MGRKGLSPPTAEVARTLDRRDWAKEPLTGASRASELQPSLHLLINRRGRPFKCFESRSHDHSFALTYIFQAMHSQGVDAPTTPKGTDSSLVAGRTALRTLSLGGHQVIDGRGAVDECDQVRDGAHSLMPHLAERGSEQKPCLRSNQRPLDFSAGDAGITAGIDQSHLSTDDAGKWASAGRIESSRQRTKRHVSDDGDEGDSLMLSLAKESSCHASITSSNPRSFANRRRKLR